jgi:nitrous oxidase accessory protein NosD
MGVSLSNSNNNRIYHNNFIDNIEHAKDNTCTNSWDKGPTAGGNYWSDHSCIGNPSDGSLPYSIDTDSIDRYPFHDPNRC